jgi:alkylhydroperoxidase family enzyme
MASHTALAKQQGASEALLDAMYHIDQHRDMFTPAELAALAFAERMTTDAHGVSEDTWIDLKEHFDDGQVIEIAAVIGLFNYFNRFNDALHVAVTPPPPPKPVAEDDRGFSKE